MAAVGSSSHSKSRISFAAPMQDSVLQTYEQHHTKKTSLPSRKSLPASAFKVGTVVLKPGSSAAMALSPQQMTEKTQNKSSPLKSIMKKPVSEAPGKPATSASSSSQHHSSVSFQTVTPSPLPVMEKAQKEPSTVVEQLSEELEQAHRTIIKTLVFQDAIMHWEEVLGTWYIIQEGSQYFIHSKFSPDIIPIKIEKIYELSTALITFEKSLGEGDHIFEVDTTLPKFKITEFITPYDIVDDGVPLSSKNQASTMLIKAGGILLGALLISLSVKTFFTPSAPAHPTDLCPLGSESFWPKENRSADPFCPATNLYQPSIPVPMEIESSHFFTACPRSTEEIKSSSVLQRILCVVKGKIGFS